MRGAYLLAEMSQRVWALPPDMVRSFANVAYRWASGAAASAEVTEAVSADMQARDARRSAAASASNGSVAVIPVYGVVTQRGNMMDALCGGGSVSTQQLAASIADAINDETIGAIVLDVNSPGGEVYGVEEVADVIYAARGQKPIIAYANALAASAAYWIASQATEFHMTPSGDVGSIGVLCAHEDWSKFNAENGINVTYISAGKFKTEMNPDAPLSDEAQAFQQSRVNDYYSSFTKGVARGRGVPVSAVRSDMGEGRCFGATQALATKMVDAVSTFDQVMKRAKAMAADAARPAANARAAAATRAELESRIK